MLKTLTLRAEHMILFFDTETTGLPNFKKPYDDPTQPKMLQLGAILATHDGDIIDSFASLVKIGDHYMHPMAQAAHGISRDKANSEGIDPAEAFSRFYDMAMSAEVLACHNFNFDIKLIHITGHQVKDTLDDFDLMLDEISDLPYYCTMQSTIKFCNLPFPSGRKGQKFPKLEELHRILFQEDFSGAHDAMADVTATVRCYFELKKLGVM